MRIPGFLHVLILCGSTATAFPTMVKASSFETAEDALARIWPGKEVHKERRVLTLEDQRVVEERVGSKPGSALVVRYLIGPQAKPEGYAYLEKHRVRTLPEVLMVALDAEGTVREVVVLAFGEPQEYRASTRWYAQLNGRGPTTPPWLGQNVQGITGATLTARAGTEAVRRVLALHGLLQRKGKNH